MRLYRDHGNVPLRDVIEDVEAAHAEEVRQAILDAAKAKNPFCISPCTKEDRDIRARDATYNSLEDVYEFVVGDCIVVRVDGHAIVSTSPFFGSERQCIVFVDSNKPRLADALRELDEKR